MSSNYDRSVLMVAYHVPPFTGSSGVQRTVKFCHYLRDHGWRPVVLTVTPRAYVKHSDGDYDALPADVPVIRSFCLDAARHLSLVGRYPELLALPDRWASWWPAGVVDGMRAMRRFQPDVIWSTYPVATAHLIAGTLAKANKLPWVADFRDWMTEGDYPAGRLQRWAYRHVERFVVNNATAATFTTDSCRDFYAQRYAALAGDHWSVLPNGFDEADFAGLDHLAPPAADDGILLLHSGYVYPEDRSPAGLFAALSRMQDNGFFKSRRFKVRFRGAGDEGPIRSAAQRFGVESLVDIAPSLPHKTALREMLQASALLLMQGPRFDRQVPAKAYEYLRTERPILTLAASDSESAKLMSGCGWDYVADLDASEAIATALERQVTDIETGRSSNPLNARMRRYDRRSQSQDLARLLDAVADQGTELVRT